MRRDPRQANLRRRRIVPLCNLADALHQGEDLGEVFLGVLGDAGNKVALRNIVVRLEDAGEEAAPNGAVRDNADSQLATRLEDFRLGRFNVEEEQAIFDLVRGNGVDGVRSTNGCSGALGQTEVANLALTEKKKKLVARH